MITYRWDSLGYYFHLFSVFVHVGYLVLLFMYLEEVYHNVAQEEEEGINSLIIVIFILVAYPFVYEVVQLYKAGFVDYFSDLGNFMDIFFITSSVSMGVIHSKIGPHATASKYMMVCVIMFAIRRTFLFMRIFSSLSPIVTMLQGVIWQLRLFMSFLFIILFFMSLTFGVIGLGNPNSKPFLKAYGPEGQPSKNPYLAYEAIGLFYGNIYMVLRIALGDFAAPIEMQKLLAPYENYAFWAWFLFTLVFVNVILLNFVVAEAGNTYSLVSEKLSIFIEMQRAEMCGEAQEMIPNGIIRTCLKNKFPKYYIIRKT